MGQMVAGRMSNRKEEESQKENSQGAWPAARQEGGVRETDIRGEAWPRRPETTGI